MGKVDYRITAKWAQLGVGKPGEHEAPDQSRKGRMTSGLCGERNIHSSLCKCPGPHIPCSANPQQPSAKRVLRYISYQGRSRGGNALLVRHIPQKAVEKKEESTLVYCQDEGLIIHHHSRCGSIADSIGMRVIVAAQGTRTAVHSVSSGVCTAY
ncbi:conserved hypothetical protein [Coccidioides posadasii str. Silveira]|uniref:Uncharacterized protein n=2 Tax=Coccidioides posadasii TaxID=199306 RepID=E9CS84_COCPS|nr:conserved hypothetical protein [Coccidioides posadasii str. Silveira]KMM63905.1 hypothetical protein CPAG_00258 [Coccidioides posadasii RMSCC 3488]